MGKSFSDSTPRSNRSPLFEIYANTHTTKRVPETESLWRKGCEEAFGKRIKGDLMGNGEDRNDVTQLIKLFANLP